MTSCFKRRSAKSKKNLKTMAKLDSDDTNFKATSNVSRNFEKGNKNDDDDDDKPWISTDPLPKVAGLPDYGYRIHFDHVHSRKCRPFNRPRLRQMLGFVGFFIRYSKAWYRHRRRRRRLFIDNFNMVPWKPIYGAPVGGIGCGTIGRGYRGEFCRFQMIPGVYQYNVVDADQFILTVRRNNETVYQNVLSPHRAPRRALQSWKWEFPREGGIYQALYPFSWTVYDVKEIGVRLICKQTSPFLPGDYKDSSLPCAIFDWFIENHTDEPLQASITFTFKNGQGGPEDKDGGVWSEGFENFTRHDNDIVGDGEKTDAPNFSGVKIKQKFNYMSCIYAIAGLKTDTNSVSRTLQFDPNSDGSTLWKNLLEDGELNKEAQLGSSHPTNRGQELAVAICISTNDIKPGEIGNSQFCLMWYMPEIQFGSMENIYKRRYSEFFHSPEQIIGHSFESYPDWTVKIERWQGEVLKCSHLPSWYKSALFNELYFIADGGTVWVKGDFRVGSFSDVPRVVREYGRFAYLEGHEYRMYNTYDVHHYASFALLMLWPKLQLSLQYDFASFVQHIIAKQINFCMDGSVGCVKEPDCVPHDIGDPFDEPWTRLNAYFIHPTHEWKDLNVKFVLQVYRDYSFTKDLNYLKDMYAGVKILMYRCLRWDTDDDGLIDNAGFADQTFDAWNMTGASSYCGGMWLAAVKMFTMMARLLNQSEDREFFNAILKKGVESFERKLWNGEYYNFDSSSSSHHDSCMADQLAGHWFLKASLIEDYDTFPKDRVTQALRSILKLNVMPHFGGKMGAINGARPNGVADITSMQSEEFWVGVTYGLGACMIQEGLIEEGWRTAYGAYDTCYRRYGLAFQTPEAYFLDGQYRSLGYMRPLAIWAVHMALQNYHGEMLKG